MNDAVRQPTNGEFGYAFVGSYLNQCARVEAWTISVLDVAPQISSAGKPIKMPHLFGLKLKAVKELVVANPKIFNKPERITELMERFTEPAHMRSNLAHSTIVKSTHKDEIYWLFYNVGTRERFWLPEDQMKTALVELKRLAKEITDQKLKIVTPSSSPPQPKQGAASGP